MMSPSQDVTVNAAEVTHHVIPAIKYFITVLFETWNGIWSHVLCVHVAHQGCFATEWAWFVAICPSTDQGIRLTSGISQFKVNIFLGAIGFSVSKELT